MVGTFLGASGARTAENVAQRMKLNRQLPMAYILGRRFWAKAAVKTVKNCLNCCWRLKLTVNWLFTLSDSVPNIACDSRNKNPRNFLNKKYHKIVLKCKPINMMTNNSKIWPHCIKFANLLCTSKHSEF